MTKKATEVKEEKHSREYLERAELQAKDKEMLEIKHKNKMEELAYERENARLFHQQELEKIRIKSAEIRRSQERNQYRP